MTHMRIAEEEVAWKKRGCVPDFLTPTDDALFFFPQMGLMSFGPCSSLRCGDLRCPQGRFIEILGVGGEVTGLHHSSSALHQIFCHIAGAVSILRPRSRAASFRLGCAFILWAVR
ncbi:hypothetical protein NDU88_005291 [Pleurodeles waltl]|uniref:Uncharacterized protein n=1 Tax=Pleurodeles waltl TaxID=8319 RepID=A0AAV7LP53_PLEWA|nr:hypothetical protein NDU88_005291 [Pleurodeles waltl]